MLPCMVGWLPPRITGWESAMLAWFNQIEWSRHALARGGRMLCSI